MGIITEPDGLSAGCSSVAIEMTGTVIILANSLPIFESRHYGALNAEHETGINNAPSLTIKIIAFEMK